MMRKIEHSQLNWMWPRAVFCVEYALNGFYNGVQNLCAYKKNGTFGFSALGNIYRFDSKNGRSELILWHGIYANLKLRT